MNNNEQYIMNIMNNNTELIKIEFSKFDDRVPILSITKNF